MVVDSGPKELAVEELHRLGGACLWELYRDLMMSKPGGSEIMGGVMSADDFASRFSDRFFSCSYKSSVVIALRESPGAPLKKIPRILNGKIFLAGLSDAIRLATPMLEILENCIGGSTQLMDEARSILKSGLVHSARPYVYFPRAWVGGRCLKDREKSVSPHVKGVRDHLPCASKRKEIEQTIRENQVTIIVGDTGSGKSTQVPRFIFEDCCARNVKPGVVVTQPRRIAAVNLAKRVSHEMGVKCGIEIVGYAVRFDRKAHPVNTRLLFCTHGAMNDRLSQTPSLDGVTHVIVDEVHDRDVHTEMTLAILRELVRTKRPDLKLVLMSATMDSSAFRDYFSGDEAHPLSVGQVTIEGRSFPISEMYLYDFVVEVAKLDLLSARDKKFVALPSAPCAVPHEPNTKLVASCMSYLAGARQQCSIKQFLPFIQIALQYISIKEVHVESKGGVLVFLPGWLEINMCAEMIMEDDVLSIEFEVCKLHSSQPFKEQRKAFKQVGEHKRRVVLATNIAEASVTIEDIAYVIDTGFVRELSFSAAEECTTLDLLSVSKSSSRQRKGRAGRCRNGVFIALYTEEFYKDSMREAIIPEIQRVPLEPYLLMIKVLGLVAPYECPTTFLRSKCMSRPEDETLEYCMRRLRILGGLEDNGVLSPLGLLLSRLPMAPKQALTFFYSALAGVASSGANITALLESQLLFSLRLPNECRKRADLMRLMLADGLPSDHLLLNNAMRIWQSLPSHMAQTKFSYDYFLQRDVLTAATMAVNQVNGLLFSKDGLGATQDAISICNRNNVDEVFKPWPRVRQKCPPNQRKPSEKELYILATLTRSGAAAQFESEGGSGLCRGINRGIEISQTSVIRLGKSLSTISNENLLIASDVTRNSGGKVSFCSASSVSLYSFVCIGSDEVDYCKSPKTISLNIAGQIYVIQDRAAGLLKQFRGMLKKIEEYFILCLISRRLVNTENCTSPAHGLKKMVLGAKDDGCVYMRMISRTFDALATTVLTRGEQFQESSSTKNMAAPPPLPRLTLKQQKVINKMLLQLSEKNTLPHNLLGDDEDADTASSIDSMQCSVAALSLKE